MKCGYLVGLLSIPLSAMLPVENRSRLATIAEISEDDSWDSHPSLRVDVEAGLPIDDRKVTEIIIRDYCSHHEQIPADLTPYLLRRFRDDCDSPRADVQQRAQRVREVITRDNSLDDGDREYMKDLILEAMKQALDEQQKKLDRANKRWDRKKVAAATAIATLAGALTTFLVNLNAKKCGP